MLLERTIFQLDIGHVPPEQAEELGSLGYMQWLGALRADLDYVQEARRAHDRAAPFAQTSPAVAVFCDLLLASLQRPLVPMALHVPRRSRRGGAAARRMLL